MGDRPDKTSNPSSGRYSRQVRFAPLGEAGQERLRASRAVPDTIRAAGGVIVKAVFEFPGGRRFHFTDPNGNELAVWSDR